MSLWDDLEAPFNILDETFWLTQSLESGIPLKCDPLPITMALGTALKRMQTPELQRFPARNPTFNLPLFEATHSYWRSPARDFSCFAFLVPEVRQRIWAFAIANDARIIEMIHPDLQILFEDGRHVTRPEKLIQPRALLSTCVEAREEQIKALREVDLGTLDSHLINFEVDTVYFGPDSHWTNYVLWKATVGMDEERPFRKRQKWNHWRGGEAAGEEKIYDANQTRDQYRHFLDQYHPLLSNKYYELEREQFKNIAFDLEFWNETYQRRCDGQRDLMSRFPNVNVFILAAGDVGASYNVRKTDYGSEWLMEEQYEHRLTDDKRTDQPGILHGGQVGFVSGAVQTDLEDEIIEITERLPYYPKPTTMCVTRGGDFRGHGSRFIRLPKDEDDQVDMSYVDPEFDAENNDKSNSKFPDFTTEVFDLQDDLRFLTETYLKQLKARLPTEEVAARFHSNARRPSDQDNINNIKLNDVDEDLEIAEDVVEVVARQGISEEGKDSGIERSCEKGQLHNMQHNSKVHSNASSASSSSSSKSSPAKKAIHRTTAAIGDTIAEITSSKVHYGMLRYRVRFHGQPEPSSTRFARTELMFVDNEHCKALITKFHKANPEADDRQTEKQNKRKAYGSVTKGGKKVEDGGENQICGINGTLPGDLPLVSQKATPKDGAGFLDGLGR